MNTHYIKCWPEYYQAVKSGEKKAELRLNDRNYEQGDTLCIQEYDPTTGYTNHSQRFDITHVLHGPGFGLADRFVMMSLAPEALAASPAPAAAPAAGVAGDAVGAWQPGDREAVEAVRESAETHEGLYISSKVAKRLLRLIGTPTPPTTGAPAAAPAAGAAS